MTRSSILPLALGLALLPLAALAASDTSGASGSVGTQSFSGPLKLQKTFFETQNASGAALNPGSNDYGSVLRFKCANTAGCFVIVHANAQVIGGVSETNPSAIGIKLNGNPINSPYNTVVPVGSFTVMNYQTGASIPYGDHSISTSVYVTNSASLYRYNTEVKLYKP